MSISIRLDIHNSELPVLCRACEARHRGVCGALDPRQLARLGPQTRRREVEAGTGLVAAGAAVETYANVLSGVVKLVKLLSDGRQQIVGLQFAPDFLGRPFTETSGVAAEAGGRVRLCVFPRSALEALIRESPALEHRLHRQALRELDDAREWMMILGQKTAAEKVASLLLLLAARTDPARVGSDAGRDGAPRRFELPLKRSDLADFLGLTTETVSRHLTRLRKAGVIGIERSRLVTILDHDGLVAAAGQ
jgi:CRP/FNR family transcriptional regulator